MNGDKPFWMKTKLHYAVLSVGVFLALALTGTVVFTNDQTLEFIKWLLGLTIVGHAATDISHRILNREPATMRLGNGTSKPDSEPEEDTEEKPEGDGE
jgi:hypothetical protein